MSYNGPVNNNGTMSYNGTVDDSGEYYPRKKALSTPLLNERKAGKSLEGPSNGLCAKCNYHQNIIMRLLCNFENYSDSDDDDEISGDGDNNKVERKNDQEYLKRKFQNLDEYKAWLERGYPLCQICQVFIKNKLYKIHLSIRQNYLNHLLCKEKKPSKQKSFERIPNFKLGRCLVKLLVYVLLSYWCYYDAVALKSFERGRPGFIRGLERVFGGNKTFSEKEETLFLWMVGCLVGVPLLVYYKTGALAGGLLVAKYFIYAHVQSFDLVLLTSVLFEVFIYLKYIDKGLASFLINLIGNKRIKDLKKKENAYKNYLEKAGSYFEPEPQNNNKVFQNSTPNINSIINSFDEWKFQPNDTNISNNNNNMVRPPSLFTYKGGNSCQKEEQDYLNSCNQIKPSILEAPLIGLEHCFASIQLNDASENGRKKRSPSRITAMRCFIALFIVVVVAVILVIFVGWFLKI